MNEQEFVEQVARTARTKGFTIDTNRNGQMQIDFGNKKLHAEHLARLFPQILSEEADVARLIEAVAPGRPCTHRPMREIVNELNEAK